MMSKKGRILLQDALDLGCDAFLTMEKDRPGAAEHLDLTLPGRPWHQ